jgi:hypothetical protein
VKGIKPILELLIDMVALQTRVIPVSNGMRLPVLTEQGDTQNVYDWLASWSLGPRDTTWRFNNPLQDANVADIGKGTWYSSPRPGDSSRSGFLCVCPRLKAVVYAEQDKPTAGKSKWQRVFVLRMRVDPAIYETEGIVFAATLVPSEKVIIVEDMLMYKGFASFYKAGFSQRWETTQKSLQEDVFADEDLMGGLKIRLRSIKPLAETAELGVSEIIPEEAGRRRYLWIGRAQEALASAAPVGVAPPAITMTEPVLQPQDDVAIATKGAFPDQYFLTRIDGQKIGMAIVQDPGVSKEMRVKSKNNPQFRVHIKEAAEFAGSYEILSIV